MAKRRPLKRPPPKVAYRYIEPDSDLGRPMYALLGDLVDTHHTDLRGARIALAWNLSWRADVDGRLTLGKCHKVSDLHRELAASGYDFVILLLERFWTDVLVNDRQRSALLDHELCHADVKRDKQGDPITDERGRTVYRLRRHDLEEFAAIADRYGCWKKDLEHFAEALERGRLRADDHWVGYRSLQADLHQAGLEIPIDRIVEWNEDQRREARTYALLRRDIKGRSVVDVPAFLTAQ
jgi:hypothetical protein